MAAWDISTATYTSASGAITTQASVAVSCWLKSDGTKLYMSSQDTTTIYQYSLSTAWDISTASYDSKSVDVSTQVSSVWGIVMSSDGTKLYAMDATGKDIYQYTLSTAWDISTASYASKSLDVSTEVGAATPYPFHIKQADGTKLYVFTNSDIYQYTLSTAWDISTASYDSKTLDISATESIVRGAFFKSDGTSFYVDGATSDLITQFDLSTAWDISTGSAAGKTLDVSSQDTGNTDFFIKSDGTELYLCGHSNDKIYQYSMPSWSDTILGVSSTNIAKINGVAIADISKVNQA